MLSHSIFDLVLANYEKGIMANYDYVLLNLGVFLDGYAIFILLNSYFYQLLYK